jgi:glutathione S-transferase
MPFSHNYIKVRRALELKGLAHETLDIRPQHRRLVIARSAQKMVPALKDGERCGGRIDGDPALPLARLTCDNSLSFSSRP